MVVDDARGIEKIFLSYVWAPLGSKVKSLKKVRKLTFFKWYFIFFQTFWILLEFSRVKRMLRGRFWCLICMNQTIHCWVMAVQLQFLGFWLLEAQNVLSTTSGCKKNFQFFLYTDVRRILGVDDVHTIEWGIYVF